MNSEGDSSFHCSNCGKEFDRHEHGDVCPNCGNRAATTPAPPPAVVEDRSTKPLAQPGSAPEDQELKPGNHIASYKLLQFIAEGGMGSVWMAEQQEPIRRRVALKVIKLGMDTKQVIGRFEAERQALALMDHSNIAKVLDAGSTDNGRPYFVMELVSGIPITQYCDQHKLSTAERLNLFIQVCQAIQHAHQKGIIHRDIKPSNILVTLAEGVPVPKVIDFGIAKATGGQVLTDKTIFTAFEQFVGTPAYISPEQAEMSNLDIDTRSDIYALGVLLYELLTSRTPFDTRELLAKGLDQIRRVIREEEPPKPSTRLVSLAAKEQTTTARCRHVDPQRLIHQVRGDLDWIAMKCLEKDRTRRYETASDLAQDIQRHLDNEMVVARPPSMAYRLRRMAGRHKLAFAASAAVIATMLIGMTAISYYAVKAAKAKNDAQEAGAAALEEARRADEQATRARRQLASSHFQRANSLTAEGQALDALPYLAACLRLDPTDGAAATRLTTLLTYRSWPLPLSEPWKCDFWLPQAQFNFSPDGSRIVVAPAGATARVLDAKTGQPLTEPLKHDSWLRCAQFSPDGSRIVTASYDGTARVWDAKTGQPLTEPLKHDGSVDSAQFSADGSTIVTASADGTARVWDAKIGQPLTEPLKHFDKVRSAQFNPDGTRVVTGSGDFTARVWDAKTGQPLTEPLMHDSNVSSAQFSPDGTRIVTVSVNAARVWDAKTSQPLTEPFTHDDSVRSAEFSPDGSGVVTASRDHTARVWDAKTGQPLTEPLKHDDSVDSAQFSPDGLRIITASRQGTARVWDAKTGHPLTELFKHDSNRSSAQFSPDGSRIVTASGNTARAWDAKTGYPLTEPLKHDDSVDSAQFSPDGSKVVTASANTARVWDAKTGQPLTEPLKHDDSVDSAQFSPDGSKIVTASGNTARVWDAKTGQPLTGPLTHYDSVNSAQFSPDGSTIVTASGNTAHVWDGKTGQPLTETLKHDGSVDSAQFSADGTIIVTASGNTAHVWDARTGQPLTTPLKKDLYRSSPQLSADGSRIVTASWLGGTARVWDAKTGQSLTEPLKHDFWLHSAQFSADGSRIVTASADTTARVWDGKTGQPLSEPLKHGGDVHSAQFSPDGSRIVTASADTTARVWDGKTGQPLTEPLKHDDSVRSAQFSADGSRIVTASGCTARVWYIAPVAIPCPEWLPDLAEAVGRRHLNDLGVTHPLSEDPFAVLTRIRQQLEEAPEDDWTTWGRWFLADRSSRTISPCSKLTVQEWIQNHSLPADANALPASGN